MSRKSKLMEKLDAAALRLIDRCFVPINMTGDNIEAEPPLLDQVKAFDSVVKYYGPRTKLGGQEDENGSEFNQLKDRLHGRTPARRRRSTPPNGSAIDDGPAGNA